MKNDNLLQQVSCMHCHTQCPQPCNRPPLTQQHPPPETPGHSQASLGQSLVGSLLFSPGSWCTQGFVCALQKSVSPVLCKFWQLYGGVNCDLLQQGLCHSQVCFMQSLCPCGRPLLTHTSTGDTQTLKGRSSTVSVESPGAHKVCLSPLSVSGQYGVDSKHDFAPPTVLLGLLLCPWMWGISSKLLQCCTATATEPQNLLTWGSFLMVTTSLAFMFLHDICGL